MECTRKTNERNRDQTWPRATKQGSFETIVASIKSIQLTTRSSLMKFLCNNAPIEELKQDKEKSEKVIEVADRTKYNQQIELIHDQRSHLKSRKRKLLVSFVALKRGLHKDTFRRQSPTNMLIQLAKLMCLILIVPLNYYCFQQPTSNLPSTSIATNLNHLQHQPSFPTNNNQNDFIQFAQLDWAKRLVQDGATNMFIGNNSPLTGQQMMHQQQQPRTRLANLLGPSATTTTPINQQNPNISLKHLLNGTIESSITQQQQQQRIQLGPPAEQTAHLRALAETTRNFIKQQLPSAGAQLPFLANSANQSLLISSRYLPTVSSRLYNLLFPQQHPPLAPLVQPQPIPKPVNSIQPSPSPQSNSLASLEPIQSTPSNNQDTYLTLAQDQDRDQPASLTSTSGSSNGGGSIINLSAPYEHQSRTTRTISGPLFAANNSMSKWRRETQTTLGGENSELVAPEASSSFVYEQQVDDDGPKAHQLMNAADEDRGQHQASISSHESYEYPTPNWNAAINSGTNVLEDQDDVGPQPVYRDEQEQKSSSTYPGENDAASKTGGDHDAMEHSNAEGGTNQDPYQGYGAQQDLQYNHQQAMNKSHNQTGGEQQQHHYSMVEDGGNNNSNDMSEEDNGDSTIDNDANGSFEQNSANSNAGPMAPNYYVSNRHNNTTMNMMVPVSNGESDSSSTNEGSQLLASQLPSQYDAVIRMPPEGHYDDYFKPAVSMLDHHHGTHSSASTSLLSQENLHDYSLAPIEGGPNQNQQQQPQDTIGTHMTLEQHPAQNNTGQQATGTGNMHHYESGSIPLDYTMQYYMNQQPLRQNEANGDHSVEFIAANRTMPIGGNHQQQASVGRHQQLEGYVYHQQSFRNNNDTLHTNNNSNNSSSQQQIYNEPSAGDFQPQQQPRHHSNANWTATAANQTNSEDNVQLIVANSSTDSRDPNSNEKLITYTSEGRNYTRPGKPVRNTFVNKDLNETPLTPEPAHGRQTNNNSETTSHHNQPMSSHGDALDGARLQQHHHQQPSTQHTGANDRPLRRPIPINQNNPIQQNGSEDRSPSDDQDSPDEDYNIMGHNDEEQLLRGVSNGQYGQYNGRLRSRGHNNSNSTNIGDQIDRASEQHQSNQRARARRQQKNHNHQLRNQRPEDAHRNARHHNNNKHHHQPTRARPSSGATRHRQQTMRHAQVTEARFNPKDLIMNPPTPEPTVTESTMSSIVDLPKKVKRLRDNQPDKNELMNELLTALDRVKVAIYKLQPLTAKMNAIYRKSVTSNTRDIVMDNHKGTYAKRYPPGDYDDSYDKIHPSDSLIGKRSSMARKRRANAPRSDLIEPSGSAASSVYLPAPKELIDKFKSTTTTTKRPDRNGTRPDTIRRRRLSLRGFGELMEPSESLLSSQIIATGIGQRLSNGQVRGQLSLGSPNGAQIVYDDDGGVSYDHEEEVGRADHEGALWDSDIKEPLMRRNGQNSSTSMLNNSTNPNSSFNLEADDDDVQSPLFGYRITIFQSPEDGDSEQNESLLSSDQLADDQLLTYRVDPIDNSEEMSQMDQMVTSESSLAPSQSAAAASSTKTITATNGTMGVDLAEGESSTRKMNHDEAKKDAKKWSKESSGKKGDEEHKKKKEFKKIKHNKGVLSKESHKMHRDKQVKAHDRGAAKEKALKERTQIEFFEREQIVDDEFEKGKKSTSKAGWATGHDSKKTNKETYGPSHGGGSDSMSVGGSSFVKQTAEPIALESNHADTGQLIKGHGYSVESSSGKQSNRFDKKQMEAKGKKFKGWREKGYKIITETEFIDRGSLHDSAYKKRDKGAAHHKKLKKHEASSEGHHGSVQEHHKKSHKNEEKRSKSEEKKKMAEKEGKEESKDKDKHRRAKKAAAESKKRLIKAKKPIKNVDEYGDDEDHEQEESAPTVSSVELHALGTNRPILVVGPPKHASHVSSSLGQPSGPTLTRLLNADHDENQQIRLTAAYERNMNQLVGGGNGGAIARRSDGSPDEAALGPRAKGGPPTSVSMWESAALLASNATLLNVLENIAGSQLNKTKLTGAYERQQEKNSADRATNANSRPKSGLKKQAAAQQKTPPVHPDGPTTTTTTASSNNKTTTTTTRPSVQTKPKYQDKMRLLVNLLQQANLPQDKLISEANRMQQPARLLNQKANGTNRQQQQQQQKQSQLQSLHSSTPTKPTTSSSRPQLPPAAILPANEIPTDRFLQLVQQTTDMQPIANNEYHSPHLFGLNGGQLSSFGGQQPTILHQHHQLAPFLQPAHFAPRVAPFHTTNELNLFNFAQLGPIDYE